MMDIFEAINNGKYHSTLENANLRKQHTYELYRMFKEEALEYVGLTGHSKAEKAFSLAWSKGHSAGYHEVVQELEELANLLLND